MDRLDEIRARVAAATTGPWVAIYYGPEVAREPGWSVNCNPPDVLSVANVFRGYGNRGEDAANAAFIANSPDDIRFLLAEVDRLLAENQYLAFQSHGRGETLLAIHEGNQDLAAELQRALAEVGRLRVLAQARFDALGLANERAEHLSDDPCPLEGGNT
jgi:hypothetical protein